MASKIREDEVIVTLSAIEDRASLAYPRRRIVLSKSKPKITIGRASNRNRDLEPRVYNAWFDSPVMSRDHAEITFDSHNKMIFIKDIGSLHGTFLNGSQLGRTQAQQLHVGDIIKFGISIERANDKFPQCVMEVEFFFGKPKQPTQPTTFQVPDESDAEEFTGLSDYDDDGSDNGLHNGVSALEGNGLRPTPVIGCPTSDAIDLTSEPDADSSWDYDLDSASESSASILEAETTTVHVFDGDLDGVNTGNTTGRFAPASQYTETCSSSQYATAVVDHDDSLPTIQAAGNISPISDVPASSCVPAAVEVIDNDKAEALGEITGKPEYFRAREHNRVLAKCTTADADTSLHAQASKQVSFDTDVIGDDGPVMEEVHVVLEVPDTMEGDTFSLPEVEELNNAIDQEVLATICPPNYSPPPKRKFEEISELLPNERVQNASSVSKGVDAAAAAEGSSAIRNQHPIPESVLVDGNRTAKRFKQAAEFFGFAALGGAAVMSALIATAPKF